MKSLVKKLLLVSVALAIALPLAAQDKEKKNKRGDEPNAIAKIKKALSSVELNEEQKKKVDGIYAEYSPKLKDAEKAAGDAPRRMAEAAKKAKDDGKKKGEIEAAVKDAVKLTAEEQTAVDKLESLGRDFRTAVMGVLTDEQKEKAGLNKKKKKNA